MEYETKMHVMIPIFDKMYQLIKSRYAFEKVFLYEFERAHHSVFSVNYEDVFDEANEEAFEAIWPSAYKKALDVVFESPMHDSVYNEAYELALESATSETDADEFEE